MSRPERPQPVPALRGARPYAPPAPRPTIDLALDANEGSWAAGPEPTPPTAGQLRAYPRENPLEHELATVFGLDPAQVVVTAGADEALDRIFRAWVGPGQSVILPHPTFVMLPRYAALAGAALLQPAWPGGAYPTEAVLAAIDATTALIAIVSPNNPTGATATRDDLSRIARAAPHAVVLLDAAYAEFADDDLTQTALEFDNVVVTRTFSKAWGLAGCRVGYALGREHLILPLRTTASPYPVATPSVLIALDRLHSARPQMQRYVAAVRSEAAALRAQLDDFGIATEPSQANFVFAQSARSGWIRDALAGLGIAVRGFGAADGLAESLRITCPGNAAHFARLTEGIATALAPEAILFDMDGVLVDVGASYRAAIRATAADFGVTVDDAAIDRRKRAGNANDDWQLTVDLLADAGTPVELAAVTDRFERHYQGDDNTAGLRERETACIETTTLTTLADRFALGVVTGRPRADAERALDRFGWRGLFRAVICREDAALKPDPAPVRLALEQLNCTHAWMLGDTADDLAAARAARVLPLGVCPPGKRDDPILRDSLHRAGAAAVLDTADRLPELLP